MDACPEERINPDNRFVSFKAILSPPNSSWNYLRTRQLGSGLVALTDIPILRCEQ
jgi:hypothetical protein